MARSVDGEEVVDPAKLVAISQRLRSLQHEWRGEYGMRHGVHVEGDALLWWSEPATHHYGGGAAAQSFEDYLCKGPLRDDAPIEVRDAIQAALEEASAALP